MNEDSRLERLLADGVHELAPARAPDRLRIHTKVETGEVRPRPRWLALVKEPPMRLNSHLSVGSPTVRVAAILAATLLLALSLAAAGIAGQRLLAADGPIVVDQAGGGTYTTITEAIAAAEDGDEILVRPGTYTEAVVIDKDITLRGDGPVDEVVIELADALLIQLVDSNAGVVDLTLRGDEFTQGIEVLGGAPTISGVVFDGTGRPFAGNACFSGREACGGGSLEIVGGAAHAVGNHFIGGGEVSIGEGANAVFERNELVDGPHVVVWDHGDGLVLRDNTITRPLVRGIGVYGAGQLLIEGNTIGVNGGNGIDADTGSLQIRDNTVVGGFIGISVPATADFVQVSGNMLRDNRNAIVWSSHTGVIAGNTVEGGTAGIIVGNGSPDVRGNVIEGASGRGLAVGGINTKAVLTGNRSCGNGENLFVADSANPTIDGSNEICEDAPLATTE